MLYISNLENSHNITQTKPNHNHILSSDLRGSSLSLFTILFFTKQRKQKWQVQELVAWSTEEASPEGSLGVQFQSVDKWRLELFWVSQALLFPSSLATEPEPLLHFLTSHTRIQPFHTESMSFQNFDPFLCTNRGLFIPFYHMFICKSLVLFHANEIIPSFIAYISVLGSATMDESYFLKASI